MTLLLHGIITKCHVPFSALDTEQISNLLTREETSDLLTCSPINLISNSLTHMETTFFYVLVIVINTFFVVSRCLDEGDEGKTSFVTFH